MKATKTHTNTQQAPRSTKSKVLAGAAVVLSVIALVVGVRLTVAAFSASGYLKAVVATNEAANLLTSDQLASFSTTNPVDERIPDKSMIVDLGEGDTTSFTFSIYNYLQNDPTVWCSKDITYNITVTVDGSKDLSQCSLALNSDAPSSFAQGSVTLSNQMLQARRKSDNVYTITLPKTDVNSAVFKVRVTVTDSGGTTVRSMAANLMPSQRAEVQSNSWDIASADKTDSNKPANFDAYNYDITVNGTKTEVSFTWNSNLVQLDPFFTVNHAGATLGKDGHSVTMTMDPRTLRVNFYRLDGKITDSTSWDDLDVKKVEQ